MTCFWLESVGHALRECDRPLIGAASIDDSRLRAPPAASPELLRSFREANYRYFGTSILQVVGRATSFASIRTSVRQPKPVPSESYLTDPPPFVNVAMY